MEEQLKTIFSNVNEWLKFAEAKNAVLVAADGAAIFGATQLVMAEHPPATWALIYLYVFIALLTISVVIALISFLPKTNIPWLVGTSEKQQHDNLLFYGHIVKYNPKEYLNALSESCGRPNKEAKPLEHNYAEQIVINSRITVKKYELFRIALWFTISAVITPAIALIIYVAFIDKN